MDFYEVLDQVVALLQRHGRVTYRGLKAQFTLDDETLEALKDELLYSQPQVVDDEGKGLIWTGETETKPEPASTTPAQQEVPQEAQPAQPKLPSPEPPAPDAERRQLTVMFCDLADSTKLSGQLDPEDLRDVIRAYQETAAGVIQRYEGHIAQYLGDGLLVYFGWPRAHEDDAQRGVRSGLGIIEAMDTLNNRLEQDKGVRLAVRIGIHTGLVVIGEMGGGGRHEQLALGETTNIAARLEGIAKPDTVVISDTTYRLVEGYFSCDDLDLHTLKGVSTPMQTYQVREATGVHGRLDAAMTRGLTPLVGREQEVGLLLERWAQVKEGQGQVVLLSGEAGIGKSRLIQVFKDHVAEEAHIQLECRSSPYYQNTALYPITDLLQHALQWQQEDTPEQRLGKLEQALNQYRLPLEETVPLFATMLSLPLSEDQYPPLPWTPQRQRQKTLESIVAMLLEQAERQPVLFILEDLHWADPTTLELLGLLIDQAPTASLLTLLTCRPEFDQPWGSRSHLTPIALNRFTRLQIETMVQRVTDGKTLPVEVMQHLLEKTDGVPLYVEEMTKAILEAGVLKEVNGQYEMVGPLALLEIPATLQDSLMARLDRLVTAKGLAQQASVIGRQFSYELLQAVSQLDEATLQRELGRLVEAELVYQRGLSPQATYLFKHALVVDAAYESLLRSTRQQYHAQIANVLENQFPGTIETQPELLAHHYTEARLNEQAVGYWQRAGERSEKRSAYVEAIAHLDRGLKLLQALPNTSERVQREIQMQLTLGASLTVTEGYATPARERAYTRARELCHHVGDSDQLLPVLMGLLQVHLLKGELQTAHQLGEEHLNLAQRLQDVISLVDAHFALGIVLYYLGDMTAARTHLEQSITLYDTAHYPSGISRDITGSRVSCLSYLAWTLWALGYPDQALAYIQDELALAQEFAHPYSLGQARRWAALLYQLRREIQAAQAQSDAAMTLANEHEFPHILAHGMILQGWALTMQGQVKEGIAQIRQGMNALQTMGAELASSRFLTLLAEAYGKIHQGREGLCVLAEALSLVNKTEARFYEAEIHRLKGQLLLQQSPDNYTEAESCFDKALSVARHQQAKSWELRAAMSLARLWQSQNKRQDAYDLLAPVYGWFTEGFDTADLKEAKALLDDLA